MSKSVVTIIKTSPQTVLADYQKLLHLSNYQDFIDDNKETLLKLNLSWSLYYPACSTEPWQLEGVVKTLIDDGFSPEKIIPIENKTVVTNPRKGAKLNKWNPIFEKYALNFTPLTETKWIKYPFKSDLLVLNKIFPEGIEIPEILIGKQIIHLPTMKTHGHSIITGAVKNSFGGLLKEVRHYMHKHIHEGLVDLMMMQKELHPGILNIMDATVAGDGAGPRTMEPRPMNLLLASSDPVALDAVAATIMGFNPLEIPYLKMCQERGLGQATLGEIELLGDPLEIANPKFQTKKSFVIWGDQMLRKGPLRFLEKFALHSPLVFWAPLASNLYHDFLWYPLVGKAKINEFLKTDWGQLFKKY